MTDDVELVQLRAQPVAVVRGHLTEAEIPGFLGGVFGEVIEVLAGQGLAPAGPPFARYTPTGDGFEVEAGFPATGPVSGRGRVAAGELPAGPAAQVVYRGDYAGVAAAYAATSRWLADHGYVPAGAPWESYLDGPEVAEPRTVVSMPCSRGPAPSGRDGAPS